MLDWPPLVARREGPVAGSANGSARRLLANSLNTHLDDSKVILNGRFSSDQEQNRFYV